MKLLVPKFIELLWEYPCLARVSSGRLFRALAATTGKARSPRVARRVDKDSQRLSNQPELCQVTEAGSGEFNDVVAHAQLTVNLNTQIIDYG